MADLVVSIDGDSKGLVGSLRSADGAMGDMRQEAKKLSDQLREVADDADTAAGELINNLGGPGAIKAIAGVGIALGAIKTGVETFIDSSERMFQSYGDEGRQMWDKVEESLRGVNGAFAEASLGSGDLADKAARLQTMGEGVKSVWSAMMAPIGSLIDQFSQMAVNVAGLTTREQELAAQYRNTTVAIQEQANAYTVAAQMMADAEVIAMGLLGMEKQAADAAHKATQSKLIDARQSMQNAIVEREFQKTIATSNDYWGNAAVLIQKAGVQLDAFSDVDTQATKIMRSSLLTDNEKQSAIVTLKIAYEKIAPAIDDYDTAMEFATDSERESLDLVTRAAFQDKARPAQIGAVTRAVKTQTDAIKENTAALVDQNKLGFFTALETQLLRASDQFKGFTLAELDYMNANEKKVREIIEKEGISGDFRKQLAVSQARDAAQSVIGIAQSTSNTIKGINEETATEEQKTTAAMVGENIKQYGRLAGAVIAGEMSMADAARAAIGNILSAKGDEWALKAGAALFENPAAAPGYAAMAVAAYSAASWLGATKEGKEQGRSTDTPATEKAAQQPQNVTYALRVDAAFADGESIARRFSQMQAAAQSRGLIGAYGAA
jgi:hypothetical protein